MHAKEAPLYDRLRHVVDLRIPHFETTVPEGRVRQMVFSPRDTREWFDGFVARVQSAVGRSYLPIFRVSDGEFYFSVGFRIPHTYPGSNPIVHYTREALSYIRWRRFDTFLSGMPHCTYEQYRGAEWRTLRQRYVESLRFIADQGLLAIGFMRTPERFAEQYHRAVCNWFDRNQIPVVESNYVPFYFVYGLLNGPRRSEVLEGRNVLVLTSLTESKRDAIERGLQAARVRSVQFIPLSGTGALREVLNLNAVRGKIDVALIGAGVGASTVLAQLQKLNTLCIDAGHCLDLLAQPSLVGRRDFTLSAPPVFNVDDHAVLHRLRPFPAGQAR